jgi:hypothetical protein
MSSIHCFWVEGIHPKVVEIQNKRKKAWREYFYLYKLLLSFHSLVSSQIAFLTHFTESFLGFIHFVLWFDCQVRTHCLVHFHTLHSCLLLSVINEDCFSSLFQQTSYCVPLCLCQLSVSLTSKTIRSDTEHLSSFTSRVHCCMMLLCLHTINASHSLNTRTQEEKSNIFFFIYFRLTTFKWLNIIVLFFFLKHPIIILHSFSICKSSYSPNFSHLILYIFLI